MFLQIIFDPGQKYLLTYLHVLLCSIKSNHEYTKALACDNPSPSSHISTCCLMEACDIVLIFTFFFSIKGQTVQNTTVILHTLCSHFTLVSYTVLLCYCTLKLLTQELQVQFLPALQAVLFSTRFCGVLTIHLPLSFSTPTSKSESCVGSWTPLKRRWRP